MKSHNETDSHYHFPMAVFIVGLRPYFAEKVGAAPEKKRKKRKKKIKHIKSPFL